MFPVIVVGYSQPAVWLVQHCRDMGVECVWFNCHLKEYELLPFVEPFSDVHAFCGAVPATINCYPQLLGKKNGDVLEGMLVSNLETVVKGSLFNGLTHVVTDRQVMSFDVFKDYCRVFCSAYSYTSRVVFDCRGCSTARLYTRAKSRQPLFQQSISRDGFECCSCFTVDGVHYMLGSDTTDSTINPNCAVCTGSAGKGVFKRVQVIAGGGDLFNLYSDNTVDGDMSLFTVSSFNAVTGREFFNGVLEQVMAGA